MLRALLILFAAISAGSAFADQEDWYIATALEAAKKYERERLRTYRPAQDGKEVAASTIAINAHILLEAYRVEGGDHWLQAARGAADSLIAHSDMNRDGEVGWGRYWDLPASSSDGAGGNTSFSVGCDLPRNKPYDDELYDDARIGHFLVELHRSTGDSKYLEAARQMIDDTWMLGVETFDGKGFAYYKTSGACDRGWLVVNINALMAVPLTYLAHLNPGSRYAHRADRVLFDFRSQLRQGNLGYYAIETATSRSRSPGTYVERAQVRAPDGSIECNRKTGAGESCTAHLGLEARSLVIAEQNLGQPNDESLVRLVMSAMERSDADRCSKERTSLGNARSITACAAYYCMFRNLNPRYNDYCYSRVRAWGAGSQDIILGLFWGKPRR